MPCQTGRSQHVLLKKDCTANCSCCVNTAYSCGKLGCNEALINSKKPDVSQLFCNLLLSRFNSGMPCSSLLDDFGDQATIDSIFPEKHCKVTLRRFNVTQDASLIFTIEDRQTEVLSENNPDPDDVLEYYINDELCLTCTVPTV